MKENKDFHILRDMGKTEIEKQNSKTGKRRKKNDLRKASRFSVYSSFNYSAMVRRR
jgi:hypothetical protein